MTDEQVKTFVNGCECLREQELDDTDRTDYPSYELYTDELRNGAFTNEPGRQLRLVVGKDRKVRKVVRM